MSSLWASSWQWTPQLPGTTDTHAVAVTVSIYGANMFSQVYVASFHSACICVHDESHLEHKEVFGLDEDAQGL